jgi:cyclophilin family peptidyl-prolyl cis-trans isomerase
MTTLVPRSAATGWRTARPAVVASAALALLLTACGGSGGGADTGDASVANITASPTRYGQTMTVTVSGRGLGSAVEMTVEGGCVDVTRVAGTSEDTVQWTCVVRALGELVPTIRNAQTRRELGSVKVSIPTPRVNMVLTDGTRSGTVVLELDPVAAPAAVNNFLGYVNSGFYNRVLVHRAFKDVGILAGAYTNTTAAPSVLVDKPATLPSFVPAANGLLNLRGTIAAVRDANADPVTAQFFINMADNPKFDIGGVDTPTGPVLFPNVVFGKVIEGQGAVDFASGVATTFDLAESLSNVPVTPISIASMIQTR